MLKLKFNRHDYVKNEISDWGDWILSKDGRPYVYDSIKEEVESHLDFEDYLKKEDVEYMIEHCIKQFYEDEQYSKSFKKCIHNFVENPSDKKAVYDLMSYYNANENMFIDYMMENNGFKRKELKTNHVVENMDRSYEHGEYFDYWMNYYLMNFDVIATKEVNSKIIYNLAQIRKLIDNKEIIVLKNVRGSEVSRQDFLKCDSQSDIEIPHLLDEFVLDEKNHYANLVSNAFSDIFTKNIEQIKEDCEIFEKNTEIEKDKFKALLDKCVEKGLITKNQINKTIDETIKDLMAETIENHVENEEELTLKKD